jgi:hypothetical protein
MLHRTVMNSNTGYSVLGLSYAEAFGCTVPQWVKTELEVYVSGIQDTSGGSNDGGSWYRLGTTFVGVNILKTGNLIMEQAFVGDNPATPRVQAALDYLDRHWADASGANSPPGWNGTPAQYQTMFTTMKGLEFMGVEIFNAIDWFEDFSDVIVAQQAGDGSWPISSGRGNPTIITAWALLVLEKSAPPPPGLSLEPQFDINPPGDDHTVTATYKIGQDPVEGAQIDFLVESGPNAGEAASEVTDALGQADFTYTSNGVPGIDVIVARVIDAATGGVLITTDATKVWEGPPVIMEVGGDVFPVNTLAILAPWLALAAVLIVGTTIAIRRRKVTG